jgi:hypothetical protein
MVRGGGIVFFSRSPRSPGAAPRPACPPGPPSGRAGAAAVFPPLKLSTARIHPTGLLQKV